MEKENVAICRGVNKDGSACKRKSSKDKDLCPVHYKKENGIPITRRSPAKEALGKVTTKRKSPSSLPDFLLNPSKEEKGNDTFEISILKEKLEKKGKRKSPKRTPTTSSPKVDESRTIVPKVKCLATLSDRKRYFSPRRRIGKY